MVKDCNPKGRPVDELPATTTDNKVHVCAIHGMCMDRINERLTSIEGTLKTMAKYGFGFMISIILILLTAILKG